jgi:hypothetical protein
MHIIDISLPVFPYRFYTVFPMGSTNTKWQSTFSTCIKDRLRYVNHNLVIYCKLVIFKRQSEPVAQRPGQCVIRTAKRDNLYRLSEGLSWPMTTWCPQCPIICIRRGHAMPSAIVALGKGPWVPQLQSAMALAMLAIWPNCYLGACHSLTICHTGLSFAHDMSYGAFLHIPALFPSHTQHHPSICA